MPYSAPGALIFLCLISPNSICIYYPIYRKPGGPLHYCVPRPSLEPHDTALGNINGVSETHENYSELFCFPVAGFIFQIVLIFFQIFLFRFLLLCFLNMGASFQKLLLGL